MHNKLTAICPYCGKEAAWVSNEVVYGKRYGKSYMIYYCAEDNAYVGCHNNSRIPLGTMANKELREWRMNAHSVIDPLWKSGKYSRKYVYDRLSGHFGEEVHIGEADIARCQAIIKVAPTLFSYHFVDTPFWHTEDMKRDPEA